MELKNTYECMHTLCKNVYELVYIHIYILCHGSYCELILGLARTSCRLLFPPAFLALRRARRPPASPLHGAVLSRNLSNSTLPHDAVVAVVLYKHHPIIRVGAGLIHFVYVSHSRMAAGPHPRQKSIFAAIFAGFVVCVYARIQAHTHLLP